MFKSRIENIVENAENFFFFSIKKDLFENFPYPGSWKYVIILFLVKQAL